MGIEDVDAFLKTMELEKGFYEGVLGEIDVHPIFTLYAKNFLWQGRK